MVVISIVLVIIVGVLFSDDLEVTVYTRGLSQLSLGVSVNRDSVGYEKSVVLRFDALFLFVSFKFITYGR